MFKNFFKGIHILSNQMQYIRYFKPNPNYLTLWDLNKNNNYLGRWKPNPNNFKRKVDLANIDNCGDRVCGDLYNEMDHIIDLFDKKWNNDIDKHTFSNELQKLKKGNNFTIDNNMNNHNYSIKAIVDNYNERWNTNLTIEEYLKHFTRKHRGAC